MAVIKCKMCGGELKILPNSTICECEYCGSKQTIPNTDDEKRLKLYERANKLRFENEFDKAAGVYESIVAEYQSEAEAYWGLVLCKYGIEYVDDPKTGKKIPTCHRSSFDSVFDDSNFDLVMENSDNIAVDIYREEAKQIEELRKKILAVSSKEEPYDIFICYKETDENGERTIDSVLAQNVYDLLIDKGYKVFFSRITLEDKLGREYEPYIFAALNSAKVMLAFGTSYKNFNAVWVKNEWNRFLQLMEQDSNKALIPCFKNIDAYDMPKEFSVLQAQDMGKVGAVQDLLRGIDKIFGRDKKSVETTAVLKSSSDSNATVKRGYFSLEDSEWEKAIQYFDQAMDSDPENAEIHLGLFLAKRNFTDLDSYLNAQIKKLSSVTKNSMLACKPKEDEIEKIAEENTVPGYLKKKDITDQFMYKLTYSSSVDGLDKEKDIYEDKDWKKAERFAKDELLSQISSVKKTHLEAIAQLIESESQKDKATAEKISNEYDQFIEDTRKKVIDSRFQAEAQREKDYVAVTERLPKADTEQECRSIISELDKIGVYKDSQSLLDECNNKLSGIRNEQQKNLDAQRAKTKKTIKLVSIVTAVAVVLIIAGIFGYKTYQNKVVIPNQNYEEACTLMKEQKYEEAIAVFISLDGLKDSEEKIEECNEFIDEQKKQVEIEQTQKALEEQYNKIEELLSNEEFSEASDIYISLKDTEYKSRAEKQIVDYLLNQYTFVNGAHKSKLESVYNDLMLVYDYFSEENKIVLAEKNDKKCIECALDGSIYSEGYQKSAYQDNSLPYLNKIIEKEKYKDDIDAFSEIKKMYLDMRVAWERLDDLDASSFYLMGNGLVYDKSNNAFQVTFEEKKFEWGKGDLILQSYVNFYVISYDNDSFLVGKSPSVATHKFNVDGTIEELSGAQNMDVLKIFD